MMQKEFEELIGHGVSDECYEKIEVVYMESDRNFDKQGIAKFYRHKDMNGIESEYRVILKDREIKALKNQLKYLQQSLVESELTVEKLRNKAKTTKKVIDALFED